MTRDRDLHHRTGTDVGKTFVTASLIRHLRRMGRSVEALKPVVSGFDPLPRVERSRNSLEALGLSVTPKNRPNLALAVSRPLSPDLAAKREGQTIDVAGLIAFCRTAIDQHRDILLIEGVGGIMVPLDDERTMLDLMMALQLPLILVTGSYLGTISHTLTALDALFRRNLKVLATIVSETPNSTVPLADSRRGNCAFRRTGDRPAAAKVWPNRWRRNAPRTRNQAVPLPHSTVSSASRAHPEVHRPARSIDDTRVDNGRRLDRIVTMAKQFHLVLVGAATGAALTLLANQIPIGALAKSAGHADEYRVLELFDDAFEQVRQNYVEKPDDHKLIENAINGMMAALGDSYYLDAKSASHTVACTTSVCPSADIGLRFTIADGLPRVITAIDGSPAAKAGLLTGDVIATIDDQPLDQLTAYQVGQLLNGEPGSTVHLRSGVPVPTNRSTWPWSAITSPRAPSARRSKAAISAISGWRSSTTIPPTS